MSFNAGSVILGGGGSLNLSSVDHGSSYQVFRMASGASAPSYGAIDLSQGDAVTGILSGTNGGTGVNSTASYPASGVIVTEAGTETLTNKTLTAPVISSIVNSGTLTLPTATDTLVGRATTDTLTNKTLTAATIDGASNIRGSTTLLEGHPPYLFDTPRLP